MEIIRDISIAIVALLHLYFFYFEAFAWTSKGPKLLGRRPEGFYEMTKSMAANQGLYNGFLVAGLVWGFFVSVYPWKLYIWIFFLGCILVAGIVGGITVNRKIFFIQGIPALIALILVHL